MITCADLSESDWAYFRFDGWCYFYPRRDCPLWEPGGTCGRTGQRIPDQIIVETTDEP